MRKDIEIHINTGDVALVSDHRQFVRDFGYVDCPDLSANYIYGEIRLPAAISENEIFANGICVEIPYTPVYKILKVRICRVYGDKSLKYVANPTNGKEWFTVRCNLYGMQTSDVYASQLMLVSPDESYYIRLDKGTAMIYSDAVTDFNIVDANRQNSNCMLACVPSNNYRFPVTGVGLMRWINSNNMNNVELAETIRREFEDDGVSLKHAYYDYNTHHMDLELDATTH